MFKKGQLVKCADGKYGIIELKSEFFPGYYIVTLLKGEEIDSVEYVAEEDLKLIGNNFKFILLNGIES